VSRHILSISYDESLLTTRQMLLEREGYQVTSALGFAASAALCRKDGFDLFIMGHSIPHTDKEELIKLFRAANPAPVLSLQRDGEKNVESAEYHVLAYDPAEFLKVVAHILDQRSHLPSSF
jgi:DNA-binding response OmpR family regulator